MNKFIYLDNNATTFIDDNVLKAMQLDWEGFCANPSSVHTLGRKAKAIIIKAKDEIASFLKVSSDELIFTSGGTESLNTAIKGFFGYDIRGHIITTDIEHSAVFNTIKTLENAGAEVTYLKTGLLGSPKPEQIQAAIKSSTKMIVISAVNSETGVKADIEKIAENALNAKIFLVVDSVALLGKELFLIPKGVSAMAFSGHKLHGPKGIGLLYLKKGSKISPLLTGGGQENQMRSGTENLPGILGFSAAVKELKKHLPEATFKMKELRDYFEAKLQKSLKNISINGQGERICNVSNIAFEGVDGDSLLMNLDQKGIYVSKGSACSSNAIIPSRVLLNMGIDPKLVLSSLRFSLSRNSTKDEIDRCIDSLIELVTKLRKFG
ncbi:MAG: cysteine desulfurase [Chlamydiae bacterium]|nr:cysteine desulfurase [Chlamydiota bacterium]